MNDTIAAISTTIGVGAISIIRVSGKDSIKIVNKIFKGKDLEKVDSHTINYGYIIEDSEIIDEVLVSIMKSPKTFTKEDVVEINTHGGIAITNKVLELLLLNGCRLAEPGEFTKRAFMNGRIDLTEAESVMELISSQNEFSRKNSLKTLRGSIYNKISDIRDTILHEAAFIEAALDDPEHYSLDNYSDKLINTIVDLREEINGLILNSDSGKLMTQGINTVIVGKPNVGKSSILNMLLREDRAIVTDIAGTTRDALEASLKIGNIILNIIDTAGIHDTNDYVESIGVSKARQFANDADLILYVIDSSVPLDDDDDSIIDLIHGQNTVVILNKSDLEAKVDKKEILEIMECPVIETSALNEDGLEELEKVITDIFFSNRFENKDEVYITNQRQLDSLRKASRSLAFVIESIENSMSEDLFSSDLMDAYSFLGDIIGEDTDDDLADRIFSDFCMGK